MSNDITRQPMDLYEKYAAEASAVGGTRLKLLKAEWLRGRYDPIRRAHGRTLRDVVRSERQADRLAALQAGGWFEPCQREELGDPEPSWKWDRGKPRDPWALQWLLPLQSVDTEDAAIFTTHWLARRR